MAQWKVGVSNEITVITEANVDLTAYWTPENSIDGTYTEILTPFTKYGTDRYVLNHTFGATGSFLIKVVDNNGLMRSLFDKVEVVAELFTDIASTLPALVWNYTTRDITNPNTLTAADIWSYTTRDITNNLTASDVWSYTTRDITNDLTAAEVWNYATRTTTSSNELTAADVWNYAGRTITGTVNANLIEVNGIAVTIDDFKATISEVDLSGIPSAVWTYIDRSVTNMNNITPSQIWSYATRSLTDVDVNIVEVAGTPVTGIADFRADTVSIDLSGVAADVWNYAGVEGRVLTAYDTDVNVVSVNDVLVTGPDDFKADSTTIISEINAVSSEVWNYSNRSLSTPSLTASDVWNYTGRSLTDKSANITAVQGVSVTDITDFHASSVAVDTSGIPQAVWEYTNRGLTDYGNQITASDVWSHVTRSLTDKSADIVTVKGQAFTSINDFKADVSSIPTAVWNNPSRTITQDLGIPTIPDIWNYASRTLTNTDVNLVSVSGNLVTSPDDFKTDVSSISSSISSLPTNVWNYTTRSLTVNDSNIVSVNNVPVVSIDDFKADVSNINIDTTTLIADLLNTDIHAYNTQSTIGAVFHNITYIEQRIYVNTELDVNGDGSQATPYNNINDAKDEAEQRGVNTLVVIGSVTVPKNLKNMNIIGNGVPSINLNGQDCKNSTFYQCNLSGQYIDKIVVRDSIISDGFTLNGFFDNCELYGTIYTQPQSKSFVSRAFTANVVTLNMNTGDWSEINIKNASGEFIITNCDHNQDLVILEMNQGKVTIDSSCTLGTIIVRGVGYIINNSNGTTVIDETLNVNSIPSDVWSYNTRGLTEIVTIDQTIVDTLNALENYDDTIIQGKVDTISTNLTTVDGKVDTLTTNLSTVDTIVNSIPQLSEIRDEMINVTFGGLVIANNQMTITDKNGVTIAIFDLKDNNDNPTMNLVYKREVVS